MHTFSIGRSQDACVTSFLSNVRFKSEQLIRHGHLNVNTVVDIYFYMAESRLNPQSTGSATVEQDPSQSPV